MATADIRYFLGANSPDGFYSLYDQMIDPVQARRIYILKGGPGCGKSTLMRRVAARAEELGQETEYIHCSGDPDSWMRWYCQAWGWLWPTARRPM